MDLGNLVQLIGSREERIQAHDLIEDTTSAPHVHLQAVVAVSEEALWGSVPACGDVLGVGGLGVNTATRAKVAKLQTILFDENVFWLHISVKYPTAVYMFK